MAPTQEGGAMRILIVEDSAEFLETLEAVIVRAAPDSTRIVCNSRNSALAALGTNEFDYAILDLKIPSIDGDIDTDVAHGRAVYEKVKASSPGTPVCFLTAFGDEDFIADCLLDAKPSDIWGSGALEPMVRMLRKGRVAELEGILRSVASNVLACDAVELNDNARLNERERRVLRIFARRNQARSVNVDPLTGGVSGARVLKAVFRDLHGAVRLTCASRIAPFAKIREEVTRYKIDVVRLPNGRYSTHCDSVFEGASDHAGAFYTLIPNYRSLLDLVQKDQGQAEVVLRNLIAAEKNWTEGHPQSAATVCSIRRRLISDADFDAHRGPLNGLDVDSFEQRSVQVCETAQHCDLHPENILVDENFQPILIDFGTVGNAPSCLDPLTLEFAFLFHPACRRAVGDWPSLEYARNWTQLEAYVGACPFKEFLRGVRNWAVESSGGNRALYATGYAIAARQLKFPDTDKSLVRAVIEGALTAALRT
jgi:CheY-like chemotaxis protein